MRCVVVAEQLRTHHAQYRPDVVFLQLVIRLSHYEYLYPRIAHQRRAYRLYPDDMRLAAALCSAVTGEQCVAVEEFFLLRVDLTRIPLDIYISGRFLLQPLISLKRK